MNKPDYSPDFVPGQGYSEDDWNDVSDSPELSDAQFVAMQALDQMLPALAGAMRKVRGPQKAPRKEMISLRVDRRVVEHFRASGPGWQGRVNACLLKAAGLD